MFERPLVSIVIPVYNGANYLAEAIDSALAQTWPNTEVIVIDDGSDDNGATAAVAGRYAAHIRYFRQPNGGVAAALNRGIAIMRGAYFSWLSHDDIYVADKVERQVEASLAFGQRCIVIGDFEHFGADGYSWRGTTQGHNLVGKPLDAVFKSLINGCALLVPRSLFEEVGTFEVGLPTTQDYFLWYRMARKVPFVQCFHVGVRQRVHAEQGSRQSSHLDESGRMFIHLLEQTPPEFMRGYAGSEAEFLLDLRPHMSVYPAALSWVNRRLRELRAGGIQESSGAAAKTHPEPIRPTDPPKSRLAAALRGGPSVTWREVGDDAEAAAGLTDGFRPGCPVVLLLMHTIGGGSQTHVFHFANALSRRANVLFAYGSPGVFRLSRAAHTPAGGLVFEWPGEGDRLLGLLNQVGLARIDVHSAYRFQDQAEAFLAAAGGPYDLTVLDYDLFARHPHLAGLEGRFVGDDKLTRGAGDLWLAKPHAIARNAARIITLCRETAARLQIMSAGLPIVSPEHWDRPAMTVRHVMRPKVRDGEPLRIIVPGRIDTRKGSDLVVDAAELASRRRLPLRFEILGSLVVDDSTLARAGEALAVHGSYDRGSFAAALSAAAPHVAWIPTQVPETWCYVLSELFAVAMPVAATSIGALRERCHGREATWLLPYDASAETWVDLFLRLRGSELMLAPIWPAIDDLPPSRPFYFNEYLQPAQQP
jgi:glycosyltransferase involved in cell wall biosynthesis